MQTKMNILHHCADTCVECARVCTETMPQCLEMGGAHAEAKHIALLQICADICQVAARAMYLGIDQHTYICEACAKICEECADECASQDGDFMQKCAEMCRKCAAACRESAGLHLKHKKHQQPIMEKHSTSLPQ